MNTNQSKSLRIYIELFTLFTLFSDVTQKDGEWMYLTQFKSEPRLRFEKASPFYADLIFDFLVAKIKFDGFEDSGATINMLTGTDVAQGPPDIVCEW